MQLWQGVAGSRVATVTPHPMDEKALPCPFCGGDPQVVRAALMKPHGANGWTVRCKPCDIEATARVLRESLDFAYAAALAKWNRRALPASPSRGPTIDAIMFQLEDVMDACCDQPLSVDRMTLTRSWRGILETALTTPPATTSDAPTSLAPYLRHVTVDNPLGIVPAPITDAERIDAICRTVAATTDGVVIHDATPDWSVVVMNDGEVCGQGEDVRGALDKMVREDRMVQKILAEHRAAPPTAAGE